VLLGRGLFVATAGAIVAVLLAAPSATGSAFLIVAFVLLGLLVLRERRQSTLPLVLVLTTSALLALVAVARPPQGSHDLWSYAMYGRILVRFHRNPYVTLPAAFPGDPILRHVSVGWRHTASMYAPGFTILCGAIGSVTRSSALATRLVFQGLSAAGFVLCSALLAHSGAQRWVVVAIALNPLLLVTVVNGGHIDPVIAALILLAATAASRQRLLASALLLGAAVSIKLVVVLPAAALIAWTARHRGPRAGALTAVGALGPSFVGVVAFGGRKCLRPLISGSHQFTRASMWALLRHLPVLGAHMNLAALAAVAAVTAALVWASIDLPSPFDAVAAGAVGYALAAAYVLPWYLIWGLPAAALGAQRRVLLVLLAYTSALAAAFAYRPTAIGTELALIAVNGCVLLYGAQRVARVARRQLET
jgi:hypothetical protein